MREIKTRNCPKESQRMDGSIAKGLRPSTQIHADPRSDMWETGEFLSPPCSVSPLQGGSSYQHLSLSRGKHHNEDGKL